MGIPGETPRGAVDAAAIEATETQRSPADESPPAGYRPSRP
jgi:hypothetical protein